jgi:hypothetical protein
MYEIKCLECGEDDKRKSIDDLKCGYCGNESYKRFKIKEWKLHKLFKPEIMEKVFKIHELERILDINYGETPLVRTVYDIQEECDWAETQEEYKQIQVLKQELLRYFEWCFDKFGRGCLEDMCDNFYDYCFSTGKKLRNPLRICELSDKIGWVN